MKEKIVNGEEKIRKKSKIKALDVVIILLIITSLVGVYFRYSILDTLTGRKHLKEYTVSFDITEIRYTTENYINIGDKIYFYEDGAEFGTIIEASDNTKEALFVRHSTVQLVPDNSSHASTYVYPENTFIDASGRIKCIGRYSEESGFLIDGKRTISPNDTIKIKTELVTVTIKITDIQPIGE